MLARTSASLCFSLFIWKKKHGRKNLRFIWQQNFPPPCILNKISTNISLLVSVNIERSKPGGECWTQDNLCICACALSTGTSNQRTTSAAVHLFLRPVSHWPGAPWLGYAGCTPPLHRHPALPLNSSSLSFIRSLSSAMLCLPWDALFSSYFIPPSLCCPRWPSCLSLPELG